MVQQRTQEHFSLETLMPQARLQQTKQLTELTKSLLARAKKEVLKLDLGGYHNPQKDCVVLDIRPGPNVHICHDWNKFPWPIPNEVFTIIIASHVVEHVPPQDFGFLKFMEECWRILKRDGQMMISTPYGGSTSYLADPTHCNPCVKETWFFFDPFHETNLWNIYHPKPWKYEEKNCVYQVNGTMECLLIKRQIDKEHQIYNYNNGKK